MVSKHRFKGADSIPHETPKNANNPHIPNSIYQDKAVLNQIKTALCLMEGLHPATLANLFDVARLKSIKKQIERAIAQLEQKR